MTRSVGADKVVLITNYKATPPVGDDPTYWPPFRTLTRNKAVFKPGDGSITFGGTGLSTITFP